MKLQELRIGNFVYDTKGEINTVCVETFVKFNHQIQPIPLTEEWFLKFGFEKSLLVDWYSNGIIAIKINGDMVVVDLDRSTFSVNCKNVHQLQNLYFAITGEELTLKQ